MTGRVNAFTIDVEDYFQVEALAHTVSRSHWDSWEYRVDHNTERCMEMLGAAGIHATFFVLGWVAQRTPSLLRKIHAAGHEVACHGLSHQMVTKQTQAQFRMESQEAKACIEDATGAAVKGYRAATYSITRSSLWALDILEDLGFEYDSSIFPIRHDLYGIPDAPRFAHRVENRKLLELPITTVQCMGRRWPCGGGGYFRILPYALFRACLRRVNEQDGQPAIFYCHPWEIDPQQPRVLRLSARSRFRHYTNLDKTESRLLRLLKDFRWGRMDEVFAVA